MHLSNKKTACNYLYPFSSFSAHKFRGRTDIFRKSFLFMFLIHVDTYVDYFSNFTLILTKVSIGFFHTGNRYQNSINNNNFGTNTRIKILNNNSLSIRFFAFTWVIVTMIIFHYLSNSQLLQNGLTIA